MTPPPFNRKPVAGAVDELLYRMWRSSRARRRA
jgi:hypothetical protein